MAGESPSSPPSAAPDGRPHPNDVGPFASATHAAAHGNGGADPDSVDVEIQDRDVLLAIEDDKHHVRILHLQNVREDTLPAAKTAADTFLDQIKPLDSDQQPAGTVFQMFDIVYKDMSHHLGGIINRVQDLSIAMSQMDDNEFRYPKRTASTTSGGTSQASVVEGFNPVAEMMVTCFDFLERAQEIQSKSESCCDETRPKRDTFVLTNYNDLLAHGDLIEHIRIQVQARDLAFDCYVTTYPLMKIHRAGITSLTRHTRHGGILMSKS
ncbi:unnamed protein product [Clonostachys solani]|uniref:Uncharacterized protein n=1 Tax=Clonostachys solani TaxID=160281 RepID=A0A9N9ZMG9_9HYPO|nr:unnamed protein product [Clonostachys solani]